MECLNHDTSGSSEDPVADRRNVSFYKNIRHESTRKI